LDQQTLRTIGASVILVGIGFAGITQLGANRIDDPVELITGEPATTTSEETSEVPTTAAPEPFTYRVGVLAGISAENFWAFYGEQPSAWNTYLLGPTKAALFTSDPSMSNLEPELAVSHAPALRTESGWEVTVDLNPEFAWSDGTPITANDLVFTFEVVRAAGLEGSWAESFPERVVAIHAEGDHRVRIEFDERPRLAVWPHGVGLAPIMAEHFWAERIGDGNVEALYALSGAGDPSSGPLTLSSVSSERVVSVRNPGYPLSTTPDTVEYLIYPDEAAAVTALARGDIDTILNPNGLTEESLAEFESNPGVEVMRSPGNGFRYLGFNLERAPMADQAFRTALALLVDREGLSSTIPHTGPAAWSMVPEANPAWYDTDLGGTTAARYTGPMPDRLVAALGGLQDAGYTWETVPSIDDDGNLIPGAGLKIDGQTPQILTILTPGDAYDPARPDYAGEIAATLEVLGFDARPVETDFDTVVDLAFTPGDDGERHYDMYLLGWTLGDPTLPGHYRALFSEEGALNNTGYASDQFSNALRRYENASTHAQARAALWEMEHVLAADLPYLVLYGSQIVEVYRSDRVGYDDRDGLGGIQARLGGVLDVRPAS
jgi:peptide/nickel transport system substrate-binding protein